MIQFNLLPEVKQEYIKAARQKRTVIVVSFLLASTTLFIFVMLVLSVRVFQKMHMAHLDKDIKKYTTTLKNTKDLEKVLTVQNQLNSIGSLHAKKPVVSRLFGYVSQVTPENVTVGKLNVDYTLKKISVNGSADALSTINKFVDTLKFTTYSVATADTAAKPAAADANAPKPFSNVVLTKFQRSDKETTYQIDLVYNADIFDSAKNVVLTVPKITSTRSDTEKPIGELFKQLPEEIRQ